MESIQPEANAITPSYSAAGHERHCFIVMPSGHTSTEQRWFKGWYDVVIQPAVLSAGYESKLATTEEHPSAINDDIRAHLTFDPMVVVDLGGSNPEAEPNPNVMYELGIRHALGLPLVMLAWRGQRLPFDVGNQRVIMEGRELLDLETNRNKLVNFIKAAEAGHYYRPMEAVGRAAALDAAYLDLGEDSLLGALVREVRDLRSTVLESFALRMRRPYTPSPSNVKRILREKPFRKELYPLFIASGGTPQQWNRLLKYQFASDMQEKVSQWEADQWKSFIVEQAQDWATSTPIHQPELLVEESEEPDSPPDVGIPEEEPPRIDDNP
jgi:hypothetical protein